MPFRQIGSLHIYQFESLASPHLVQAIFTRRGGVSPEPWRSLNVGGTVGDDRGRVLENRRRSFSAVGRKLDSIHDVWQVHSANVVVAHQPRADSDLVQADVLISNKPQVTLFMRFADCVPILLHDPERQVVGLAHAGWLGTVRGVAKVAVRAMVDVYHSEPDDIRAGIGPAIGQDHYPVGPEVVAQIRDAFGSNADRHLQVLNGAPHFDLWSANRELLERQGVGSVEVAGLCTACHMEDWYSHRGERGETGRFGALIALSE
jgi:YfiH family protein